MSNVYILNALQADTDCYQLNAYNSLETVQLSRKNLFITYYTHMSTVYISNVSFIRRICSNFY